jgi:hypothetical protein
MSIPGAVGDGVTDDTAAIQSAVNTGTAVFDALTYKCVGISVPSGAELSGAGTLLMPVLASGTGTPILDVVGDDVSIADLLFTGQRASQPADGFNDSFDNGALGQGRGYRCGIRGIDIDGLTVDGCEATELYGAAIALKQCSNVTITDNYAHDTNHEGYYHTTEDGERYGTHVVTGNQWDDIGTGDPSVNADACIVKGVDGLVFTGNMGARMERDLIKAVDVDGFTIDDNTVSDNTVDSFAGIQIATTDGGTSRNGTVRGNTITDCKIGIALVCDIGENIEVSGNTIAGTSGSGTPDGLLFSAGYFTGIACLSNILTGITRNGLYVSKGMSNSRIEGNQMTALSDLVNGNGISINAQTLSEGLSILSNTVTGFYGKTIGNTGALRISGAAFTALRIAGNSFDPGLSTRRALNATATSVLGRIVANSFLGTTAGQHRGCVYERNTVTGADGFVGRAAGNGVRLAMITRPRLRGALAMSASLVGGLTASPSMSCSLEPSDRSLAWD